MAARRALGDEELAAIASMAGAVNTAQLARRLGRSYTTVDAARRRMRAAGGWFSLLRWTTCDECGQALAHGPQARRRHPSCRRTARRRYFRSWHRLHAAERSDRLRRERLAAPAPIFDHNRWSADADHFILDRCHRPAREIAASLGRTPVAVRLRRWRLRRALTGGQSVSATAG